MRSGGDNDVPEAAFQSVDEILTLTRPVFVRYQAMIATDYPHLRT